MTVSVVESWIHVLLSWTAGSRPDYRLRRRLNPDTSALIDSGDVVRVSLWSGWSVRGGPDHL